MEAEQSEQGPSSPLQNINKRRRRIFEFHDDERGVEYEPEYDRYDALTIALTKYNEQQQQMHMNSRISKVTHDKGNEEENELNDDDRNMFLSKMEKSLIEFHGIQRVIQLLKQKEHLNFVTCSRPSNPIKGTLLPINQRVHLRQQNLRDCEEYFQKANKNAEELVKERRNFALQCLELRKKWRIIRAPQISQGSTSTLLTHRDEIVIDCSYLTAGDMTLVNKHTVPIPIRAENYVPSRPPTDYYTIQYSLSHVRCGDICTQTLWNILHGESNHFRERYLNANEIPQADVLEWQCQLTQHDVSVRSFFSTLINIERESRLLNTDSVLYDIWNTSSTRVQPSDSSLSLLFAIFQEPFIAPLHIVSHTRSQIILSVSASLQLIISQAPLFQTPCDQGNIAYSSLLSPLTPSSSIFPSQLTADFPSFLSSNSMFTLLSSAGLTMEQILLSSQRNQHSALPVSQIKSRHAIYHSSPSATFTPHSDEFNWNTFLLQARQKVKQIPKYHYTYRNILLTMKEISQSHLLFYRLLYCSPVPQSISLLPFSSEKTLKLQSRGVTLQIISNSQTSYYLSTQFLFHISIAGGFWKHDARPHFFRLLIFPTYLELEDSSPMNPSPPPDPDPCRITLRADSLLFVPPSGMMNQPQSFSTSSVSVHRFESCELFWKYLICHTVEK